MSDTYRVLVTGSRDWTDYETVEEEIGRACVRAMGAVILNITIVHGACPKGADMMARRYVTENWERAMYSAGVQLGEEPHPADWSKGKGAGYVRNSMMVGLGADECLAFGIPCVEEHCPGDPHVTHGTGHCALVAEAAGIEVRRYGKGWTT